MVRTAASRTGALLLVFLLVSVVFFSPPTAGAHFFPVEIPPPHLGDVISTGTHENHTLDTSFDEVDRRLLGHHEERTVVLATTRDPDGNVWYEHEVFDAETGLHAGHGYASEHRHDALPLFDWQYGSDHVWVTGPVVHAWLPESVLWGRDVWVDDSWEIPVRNPHCEEAAAGAEISPEWSDEGYIEAIHAVVWRSCVRDGDIYGVDWTLAWGPEPTPVADVRIMTVTDPSGVVSEHEVPATIAPGDGPELPFRGHSHVAFWSERDQTLGYTAQEGMLPTDPEPHAIFDVNEAAKLAYDLDDEIARVFRSQTTDPTLFLAKMTSPLGLEGGYVRWHIAFTDPSGASLWVNLNGLKLAGQPFIVYDASAGDYPTEVPEPDDPAAEVAHPGDLARLVDGVAEHRDARVAGYSWERWYQDAFAVTLLYSGGTGVDEHYETVHSGLTDGIVTGHGTTHHGYTPDPPGL